MGVKLKSNKKYINPAITNAIESIIPITLITFFIVLSSHVTQLNIVTVLVQQILNFLYFNTI